MIIELVYLDGQGYLIKVDGIYVSDVITKEEMHKTTIQEILDKYFEE